MQHASAFLEESVDEMTWPGKDPEEDVLLEVFSKFMEVARQDLGVQGTQFVDGWQRLWPWRRTAGSPP
jgi:hypothetical protein